MILRKHKHIVSALTLLLFILATSLSMVAGLRFAQLASASSKVRITQAHDGATQGIQQLCEKVETENETEDEFLLAGLELSVPFLTFRSLAFNSGGPYFSGRAEASASASNPLFLLVRNFRI